MDIQELQDCIKELDDALKELDSGIASCIAKGQERMVLMLKNQYFDVLESKQVLSGIYNKRVGGKNEVIYPTA